MKGPLFRQHDLRDFLDARKRGIEQQIGSLAENQVLNSSHSDLCTYFVESNTIDAIEIDEEGIEIEYGDAQVDIRHRFDYAVRDRSRPAMVVGTRIGFFVPFVGDQQLLQCRPSPFRLDGGIHASCRDGHLIFVFDRTAQDIADVGEEFQRSLDGLRSYLGWIRGDVSQYNQEIEGLIDQCISSRREKVLRDRGIVESLGYPLKRSSGVPATYTTPDVKRRVAPRLPSASTMPYQPEPALDMKEYENILSIMSNMVLVMERSPHAFRGMNEEDLRQHFLVQLNGQYEGQATGETFNYEGKTDILIRVDDRNIFIAECKFWTGPSGLSKALDQLLGYACWRDTKTAILVFNRNKNLSVVLGKIRDVVRDHASFKAERGCDSETMFRFVLSHRDDPNRELVLTILVFDVPA